MEVFSTAFGGFQAMSPGVAAVCTPYGYRPYRLPHLSLSGLGLRGQLGTDVLSGSSLLGDSVPVSNLISLDLSGNEIWGALPGWVSSNASSSPPGSSAFRGYDFPALVWNLSGNRISGGLPKGFYLHSALVVDLSRNILAGPLPDNWTLLESVVQLDLSGKSLRLGRGGGTGTGARGRGQAMALVCAWTC